MDQAKLFLSSFGGDDPGPGDPGDPIGQSLRFRDGNNTQFLESNTSFASSSTEVTISYWIKIANVDQTNIMPIVNYAGGVLLSNSFDARSGFTPAPDGRNHLFYGSSHTSQVYEDPSAWYHIVQTCGLRPNPPANTISNNVWINGVEITGNDKNTNVVVGQADTFKIGRNTSHPGPFQGYIADFYFIDGQALEPTVFGRYNANNVWVPVAPQGLTFGSNGFHLDFSDPNDIGADRSPNANHFTATGFDTVPPASVTGTYVDPSATNFVGGSFPTGDGSIAPYFIDAVPADALGDHENTGLIHVFNGIFTYLSGTSVWYGTQYANNVLSCNFDLRDFTADGVTSVEINDSYGSPNPRPFSVWLLDASKNKIPGSDLVYDDTKNGEFQSIPVPEGSAPAFIHFDCENEWRILSLAGIRINGIWINQISNPNSGYDLMQDSPTQNYATINPLEISWFNSGGSTIGSIQDANMTSYVGSAHYNRLTQYPQAGQKLYMECIGSNYYVGFAPQDYPVGTSYLGSTSNRGVGFYLDGNTYFNSAVVGSNATFTTSDLIQLAYDVDTGNVWHGVNGTWHNSGDPATGANPTYTLPFGEIWQFAFNENSAQNHLNLGQQPFLYTPPEGFTSIQTQNLPEAPILNGRDHFQALTGPGSGAGTGGRSGAWLNDLFSAPPGDREQAHTSTAQVFQSAAPATLAFDGNLGTVAETDQSQGRPGWMSFRSSNTTLPELTANTTFKLKIRRIAELWVNGTQMTGDFTTTSGAVFDLSSQLTFPFTLESLEIGAISGQDAGLFGIELDGELLVQQGILESAQTTFPNGLWWIKDRVNDSTQHQFVDSLRGNNVMNPCPVGAYTMIDHPYDAPAGDSVAWCWSASEAFTPNVSEFVDGSGTRNLDAGFSIVLANNAAGVSGAYYEHGLNETPEFIIAKSRTNAYNWIVYHSGLTDAPNTQRYLYLSGASAELNNSSLMFDLRTEGQVILGTNVGSNRATDNFVYYNWHSVPGYSQMGQFVANNSDDGPFVYLGFKPAFLLCKGATNTENWVVLDSTRSPNNLNSTYLIANNTNAEKDGSSFILGVDFLSNGFKCRGNNNINTGTGRYVYVAFAENPFSSPVTAR